MYKVIVINGGVETLIHYPTPDLEAPHLPSIGFKEGLSLADSLSFTILINNIGYNLIEGLITKVKVIDTRDDSTLFSGRVMPTKSNMNSSGLFYKEVVCEGALAYLNDTQTRRWNLRDQTPTQILTYLLAQHNAKVDVSRQIQLGIVEITQAITIDTNYETTITAIISKIRNILGGDIRVREVDGILYLDYLKAQGTDNGVKIELGYNMKDIIEEYDPLDLVSRIIPLGYGEGINQLTINKVNNNIEYLDDAVSIAKYGVIEGVVTNLDIQNANTLKIYGSTVLAEKSQPSLTIGTKSLDLSVLAGYENEKYANGDSINILNHIMNIDVIARVIGREIDLLAPYNPSLEISTRSIRLTDQIIELKQRNTTLENAPQGNTFITTMNACDNLDEDHNIQIPIWLSPDIIYVNRVMLHVESQKFRAYEKGMAAAAQQIVTSSSGGGSTQTSSSGGASTPTSSSGGASTPTSSSGGGSTSTSSNMNTYLTSSTLVQVSDTYPGGFIELTRDMLEHSHNVSVPAHSHTVSVPSHTHSVSVPAHSHTVAIPNHTHTFTIPEHTHAIQYGIFEDTYTAGSKILIDGVVVADGANEGSSIDIDISQWVGTPGQTYSLEVSSTQRGRVAVQVNIQAFIQSK